MYIFNLPPSSFFLARSRLAIPRMMMPSGYLCLSGLLKKTKILNCESIIRLARGVVWRVAPLEPGFLKAHQPPPWRVEKPPAGRAPRRGPKGPLPMSLPCLTKIKSRSSRRRLIWLIKTGMVSLTMMIWKTCWLPLARYDYKEYTNIKNLFVFSRGCSVAFTVFFSCEGENVEICLLLVFKYLVGFGSFWVLSKYISVYTLIPGMDKIV